MNHFRFAAKYAVLFDTIPQADGDFLGEYTSLLFRGLRYPIMRCADQFGKSKYVLDWSRGLDALVSAKELEEIREELRKYVK